MMEQTTPSAAPQRPANNNTLRARVHRIRHEPGGVIGIELHPASSLEVFPAFTAGAHIDVHMGNGITRSYSLYNTQDDVGRYAIGVMRDRQSRGGSAWMHGELHVGDELSISAPRNHFRLHEDAPRSVFVSGGIGITPLLSMIRRQLSLGKEAHLLYCARRADSAPFLLELRELASQGLRLHHHYSEDCGAVADLHAYLRAFGAADHFYCCGPAPMLDAFEQHGEALGFPNCHVERFRPADTQEPRASSTETGACTVELAASGRTLTVHRDQALLQVLLDAGIDVQRSCEEGVCGSCETRILEGEAEHRDSVLSKAEKASHTLMMVCVSRCKSSRLVLDL